MSKNVGESAKNGRTDGDTDGRRVTTLELICSTLKQSHMKKMQLNMSKHVGEKCGNCAKPRISYILSSKIDITPSKINAN